MPVDFDPAVLEQFFGIPCGSSPEGADDGYCHRFVYSGLTLQYMLFVDSDRLAAMISGDTRCPFGGESIFEIAVPCSAIRLIPVFGDPGLTRQIGEALAFYYGDISDQRCRMMTIFKRGDTDLVVCPSWPYPAGHPNAYPEDQS
jgi:hypothetical protein